MSAKREISEDLSLYGDIIVQPVDVLCGKGKESFNHGMYQWNSVGMACKW